jgi:sugar phosphate isomerase/epimerase
MRANNRTSGRYTRREFSRLALAGLPAVMVLGERSLNARQKINSPIKNVDLGAITYSFRGMTNPDEIIKAYVTLGLGSMELMSNHAEALAGMPAGPGRGNRGAQLTPEQQAAADAATKARNEWKRSATTATWAPVRKKIEDAGIALRVLCYNMNVKTTTDDDIEYGFNMAKGLGVNSMSTSTQVSMAKRLAPFAEKHKVRVGFHGHNDLDRPDEVSSKETFEAVMAAGQYLCANLDIGHFTAANGDSVAFIKQHHARITNLHIKDMKRNGGPYVPFGQGDSPLKEVLQLLSNEKWDIPCSIEYEYNDPDGTMAAMQKCIKYCKDALA